MPDCRIVIPVYRPLTDAEFAVVRHNLSVLSPFPAVLIGRLAQRDLLDGLATTLSRTSGADVRVETFADAYFDGIDGYNRLLTGLDFFQRFSDASHVLICQHDALVLRPTLGDWLNAGYDFVGAPIFRGYHAPERPLHLLNSLNGGLSLRNVPAALSVLRGMIPLRRGRLARAARRVGLLAAGNAVLSRLAGRRLLLWREGLNEDIFWSETVPTFFPSFRLPPPEIAARFAFETCPRDLFVMTGGELPFGCHAFQRYDPAFWVEHAPADLGPVLAASAREASAATPPTG